jgi:endoglucanase
VTQKYGLLVYHPLQLRSRKSSEDGSGNQMKHSLHRGFTGAGVIFTLIVTLIGMLNLWYPGSEAKAASFAQHRAAALPNYLKGVHLSGAEYNDGPDSVLGSDYIYPENWELDYYKSKGFSTIRLSFDISRVQPQNLQALNTAELREITRVVRYAQTKGLFVILDPHNYGEMWNSELDDFDMIGSEDTPNSYFADFWRRLARVYKDYPNVIFGLMNEPVNQTPQQWRDSAEAAINAIRGVATTQLILIPGTRWTTAARWVSSGNAQAWEGYSDPVGGPFMFEMHQYLDADMSGTHPGDCSVDGSTVLSAATNWLEDNGYEGFLAEFAWFQEWRNNQWGYVSPQCEAEGRELLSVLQSDPWGGWTWCCSGPWAGDSGMNLDPDSHIPGDQPQTYTLLDFIP